MFLLLFEHKRYELHELVFGKYKWWLYYYFIIEKFKYLVMLKLNIKLRGLMTKKRLEEIVFEPSGTVHKNLPFNSLITHAIKNGEGELSIRGTLVINTREDSKYGKQRHTGRSPKDRFMVQHPEQSDIDWNNKSVNQAIEPNISKDLYEKVISEFNKQPRLYHMQKMACADTQHAFLIDFWSNSATRSLFVYNQFRDLPADKDVLGTISQRPVEIYFLPDVKVKNPERYGLNSDGFVIIDYKNRKIYSLGMAYCGEVKKAVFQ